MIEDTYTIKLDRLTLGLPVAIYVDSGYAPPHIIEAMGKKIKEAVGSLKFTYRSEDDSLDLIVTTKEVREVENTYHFKRS